MSRNIVFQPSPWSQIVDNRELEGHLCGSCSDFLRELQQVYREINGSRAGVYLGPQIPFHRLDVAPTFANPPRISFSLSSQGGALQEGSSQLQLNVRTHSSVPGSCRDQSGVLVESHKRSVTCDPTASTAKIKRAEQYKRRKSINASKVPEGLTARSSSAPVKNRSQRLGDKVKDLQDLVSPFGKTDTASVLQKALDSIKDLHNQVLVLTFPYILKSLHTDQVRNETTQSLRQKGLCLVPVANVLTSYKLILAAADSGNDTFLHSTKPSQRG